MERGPNEPCFDETFRYDNALIKPHCKSQEKTDFKVKYVLIDSRDRNYKKYPNSNDFQIMLNEPIKDVVEVELIQAHIPTTSYLINNNNNKIYYYIGTEEKFVYYSGTNDPEPGGAGSNPDAANSSKLHVAVIEPGDWDSTNIADRITEAFRLNGHDISVYYYEPTNKFSFVYNDDSDIAVDTAGSNKKLYLDFRKTNHNLGDNNGQDIVVSTTNYDNNGNTDTSYKNQSIGEILGFSKNYYTTDTNSYVDFDNVSGDAFGTPINFTINLYDENGIRLNDPTEPILSATNIVSYFVINLNKNDILIKNPNFKFTIGSVIKVFYKNGSGYITGIIDDFLSLGPHTTPTGSDKIKCTWVSGIGADIVTGNNNGTETGLDAICSTMSDTNALLGGDDYILLKIPNLERFEGRNTNIEKSYAKLHLGNSTRNIFFGRIHNTSNLHVCEPTIQKFDRIHLQYTDYYGNPYDFNNAENSLIFAIKYKVIPYKYDF